jgi:hypothetical protein
MKLSEIRKNDEAVDMAKERVTGSNGDDVAFGYNEDGDEELRFWPYFRHYV